MDTWDFLRVVGRLYETDQFDPGWGWQSRGMPVQPNPDPDLRLELLDPEGMVVSEGRVELEEPACGPSTNTSGWSRLVGYVALPPTASSLQLRRDRRGLYSVDMASEPPRLGEISVRQADGGHISLTWDARHDRPVRSSIAIVDARRRLTTVARDLDAQELRLDVRDFPLGDDCHIAVGLTDGLRSTMARSERVDLPTVPPELTILEPLDGAVVAPDQPISLIGQLTALAGDQPRRDGMRWTVDGTPAGEGAYPVVVAPLDPGEHSIRLTYDDDAFDIEASVTVTVRERNRAEESWYRVGLSPQ